MKFNQTNKGTTCMSSEVSAFRELTVECLSVLLQNKKSLSSAQSGCVIVWKWGLGSDKMKPDGGRK